jgi:hypothetical protein
LKAAPTPYKHSTFERNEAKPRESALMLNLTRRRLFVRAVPTEEILLISHLTAWLDTWKCFRRLSALFSKPVKPTSGRPGAQLAI